MKEVIKPTTSPDFDKGEAYVLEDKDYLLITAINRLADELNMARRK